MLCMIANLYKVMISLFTIKKKKNLDMAEGVVDSNLETPKAQIVNGWVGVQIGTMGHLKIRVHFEKERKISRRFQGERYTPHKYTSLYYFGIM